METWVGGNLPITNTYAEYASNDPNMIRYDNASHELCPILAGLTYFPVIPQTASTTIPAISICNPTLNKISIGGFCFDVYTVPNDHDKVEMIASITPRRNDLFCICAT